MSTFQFQKAYLYKCKLEHKQSLVKLGIAQGLKTNFKLGLNYEAHSESQYEVILSLNFELKQEDQTVATIQLQQAGLFKLEGYTPEQLDELTKSYCPHLLFPYLREETARLTQQAGFSTVELPLMDFNAIYQQQKLQAQQKAEQPQEEVASMH
jgi:preprotein translocase subunit SecB